jgi:hypothetical protein
MAKKKTYKYRRSIKKRFNKKKTFKRTRSQRGG